MVYNFSIHVDPDNHYLIFLYVLKCSPKPYLYLRHHLMSPKLKSVCNRNLILFSII